MQILEFYINSYRKYYLLYVLQSQNFKVIIDIYKNDISMKSNNRTVQEGSRTQTAANA